MNKMDEQILVVKRDQLFSNEQLAFQGIQTNPSIVNLLTTHIQKGVEIKRRGNMEEDPSYKQPIPYLVVRQGGRIFAYKRLSGGGEERLFSKVSIGVGGHMNKIEGDDFNKELLLNAERELNEELRFIRDGREETVHVDNATVFAFINDDENEVGRVHIGLAVIIDFHEDWEIGVRETDTLEGEFLTIEELGVYFDKLESWSQIIYDELVKNSDA